MIIIIQKFFKEKQTIKDKIKYLKGKDEFGYALGAVCPNPSGVDVLFAEFNLQMQQNSD